MSQPVELSREARQAAAERLRALLREEFYGLRRQTELR